MDDNVDSLAIHRDNCRIGQQSCIRLLCWRVTCIDWTLVLATCDQGPAADGILLPFCVWTWAINNELGGEKDLIESRWLVIVLVQKPEKNCNWAVIEKSFTIFIETKINKSFRKYKL